MSEQVCTPGLEFVQKANHEVRTAERISAVILQMADAAIKLASVYRMPRYEMDRRENDAEHSYLLAMITICTVAILKEEFPEEYAEVSVGEAAEYALSHELIELISGDVQTFNISETALATKTQQEDDDVEAVCAILPGRIAGNVRRYQKHEELVIRIVGLLDKIAPYAVDALLPGPTSKVMHEDYGVNTDEELYEVNNTLIRRYKHRYPERKLDVLHVALHSIIRRFETQSFVPSARPSFVQDALFEIAS
ncbi:MAG: YfbR-like 5'-deoxynucleotidase [Candidatus Saccharimonadales bacterium]